MNEREARQFMAFATIIEASLKAGNETNNHFVFKVKFGCNSTKDNYLVHLNDKDHKTDKVYGPDGNRLDPMGEAIFLFQHCIVKRDCEFFKGEPIVRWYDRKLKALKRWYKANHTR